LNLESPLIIIFITEKYILSTLIYEAIPP